MRYGNLSITAAAFDPSKVATAMAPNSNENYQRTYDRIAETCEGRMGLMGEFGGLGRAIHGWLLDNNWPQLIFEQWTREIQPDGPGPWASQIGKLIKNELEPYPFFFKSLALFNHDVAYNNVDAIRNPKLKERLLEGQPFVVGDWGRPATSEDFYKLFIGELMVPEKYYEAVTVHIDIPETKTRVAKLMAKQERWKAGKAA